MWPKNGGLTKKNADFRGFLASEMLISAANGA
jgi:hypothetical protein